MDHYKVCHVASIDMTVRFLLLPQLEFLKQEGYDVSVACSAGPLLKEVEKRGIKTKAITLTRKMFTPVSDIVAFFKLYAYFRKEKFDIVHTHAPKPALLGQMAARMAGVPIVINTIHGLYFTEDSSSLKKSIFIFLEKFSALFSNVIFSQNKEDMNTLLEKHIAKQEKIVYLGNGIDMKRFNPEKYSKEFIANKKGTFGLSQDSQIIGIVGRLVKEKGYLELFEAMRMVSQKNPNAFLVSVGPNDSAKKDAIKKNSISDYSIADRVLFLGQRQDIEELYPFMDIFVLPSHREGFPRSVIEAMAMEKAIVVTDIRGCREEIDNKENGLVVPVKNATELARAIEFLLNNKEEAKELAKNARIKALSQFDEKMVFERIKKEYNGLITKKYGN